MRPRGKNSARPEEYCGDSRMSVTQTQAAAAPRIERVADLRPLAVGVVGLVLLAILLRGYEQLYGWSEGLDSFAPEFQSYWTSVLKGSVLLYSITGISLVAYLWRTRTRDFSKLTPTQELRRLLYLVQWLVIFALALALGLSFFSEQTAVWHMTAVRDTDFTPSNIMTFYVSYPLFAILGAGAFFYAKTRLPLFARGYSLAFLILVVGVFMTIPNVGFNEWGHTAWSMDEGFAGPLHWGFVFFGWMSLAVFGVVLQILGRLRDLLGTRITAELLQK
jgi:methane/ammonia monooxygenase subunit C